MACFWTNLVNARQICPEPAAGTLLVFGLGLDFTSGVLFKSSDLAAYTDLSAAYAAAGGTAAGEKSLSYSTGSLVAEGAAHTVVKSLDGGTAWAGIGGLPAVDSLSAVDQWDGKIVVGTATSGVPGVAYRYDGVAWTPIYTSSGISYPFDVAEAFGYLFVADNLIAIKRASLALDWATASVTVHESPAFFKANGYLFLAGLHAPGGVTTLNLAYTSDGLTWAQNDIATGSSGTNFHGLAFGNGVYLLTFGTKVYRSSDRVAWVEVFDFGGFNDLIGPVFVGGKFVVARGFAKTIHSSSDGVTWNTEATLASAALLSGLLAL